MLDIIAVDDGGVRFLDSQLPKAKNVLEVQLGSLEYAQDFGVDLAYFLSEEFTFMNESFKAYLVQRLSESSINVSSLLEVEDTLFSNYIFNISDDTQGDGLIER